MHPDGVSELAGGGIFGLRPGQVTDETDMALCLARSLVRRDGYDPEDVVERYLEWHAGNPFGIGATVDAVLADVQRGMSVPAASRRYHLRHAGLSSGNGSLMRIHPLAARYAHDLPAMIRFAHPESRLTHHDPQAARCCQLWCLMLASELSGEPARRAPALAEDVSARAVAHRALSAPAFVRTTFAVGCCAASQDMSIEDGLRWAVALGGDTDTNAAVVGALLGARYGASAIPRRWLDQLEGRDELDYLADALACRALAG